MPNPETLARFQRQDLNIDQGQNPVEGKSFENLRRFVAFGAVAPIKIYPPGEKADYSDKKIYYPSIKKGMTLQNWERNLRMVWDYAFEEYTLEEIAKRNGNLTREAIRQAIKRTVKGLYEGAGNIARDRFAFESFDFAKPRTIASRQRASSAHGGLSLKVSKRLEQGGTIDDLKSEFTTAERNRSRRVIKNWGIELEKELKPILPQFEGLGDPLICNKIYYFPLHVHNFPNLLPI